MYEANRQTMRVYAVGMVGIVGLAATATLAPSVFRAYGTFIIGGFGLLYAVGLSASMRSKTREVEVMIDRQGVTADHGLVVARVDVLHAFVREPYGGGSTQGVTIPATPPMLELVTATTHHRFGVISIETGVQALQALELPVAVVPPTYVATAVTAEARGQRSRAWMWSIGVAVVLLALSSGSAYYMMSKQQAAVTLAPALAYVSPATTPHMLAEPSPLIAERTPPVAPSGESARSASIGTVKIVMGPLKAATVTRVARASLTGLTACIRATPTPAGTVTATLRIDADGTASSVRLGDGDRVDHPFAVCVGRAIASWKFPPAAKASTAIVPIVPIVRK